MSVRPPIDLEALERRVATLERTASISTPVSECRDVRTLQLALEQACRERDEYATESFKDWNRERLALLARADSLRTEHIAAWFAAHWPAAPREEEPGWWSAMREERDRLREERDARDAEIERLRGELAEMSELEPSVRDATADTWRNAASYCRRLGPFTSQSPKTLADLAKTFERFATIGEGERIKEMLLDVAQKLVAQKSRAPASPAGEALKPGASCTCFHAPEQHDGVTTAGSYTWGRCRIVGCSCLGSTTAGETPCERCDGKGEVRQESWSANSTKQFPGFYVLRCPDCNGSGRAAKTSGATGTSGAVNSSASDDRIPAQTTRADSREQTGASPPPAAPDVDEVEKQVRVKYAGNCPYVVIADAEAWYPLDFATNGIGRSAKRAQEKRQELIAALRPLLTAARAEARRDALEEAAKACEERHDVLWQLSGSGGAAACARRIRALAEQGGGKT